MINNYFDIVDGKVVINANELSIPVFRKIYEADKTKDKVDALNEISYVIFMYKWDSPYASYLDEDVRNSLICKDLFNNEKWTPSVLVKEAIQRYKDFQNTLSVQYLQNTIDSIKKVMEFNTKLNWEETDKNGKLLYSVKDLSSNIKDAGSNVKSLQALIESVKKEELENSKVRGGGEVHTYESMGALKNFK